MAHTSSLVFAGIAPHPPIMVPDAGREAIAEVRSSIDAMAELTQRVIDCGAETVITISPHAPLDVSAFVAFEGPQIYGDFANFRAPTATVHAELDDELLKEIERVAAEQGLSTKRIRGHDLDHGTAVPLYFLQRNGWRGKVIALGYSFVSGEDHVRFGQCIKQAVEKIGRPVAFIASGDLSHRLKLGAPAGFNPDAHLFDEEVVDAIRNNATQRIVNIDQEMRQTAGECGYRSMLVAIGAVEGLPSSAEVISYEAPYGVGYLVAQLLAGSVGRMPALSGEAANTSVSEPAAIATGSIETLAREPVPFASADGPNAQLSLPSLARRTVETFVTTKSTITPPDDLPGIFKIRAGCFVCIKTGAGDLRGCIGTIDPAKNTLAEEIIWNAISAATRDPRFSPVRVEELPNLKYSVDVLTAPEPATIDELDPRIYGVIVEEENGSRRGLLLPNLEGIHTTIHQLEIASRKAGIPSGAPVKLFRFRAERYSE
jgi:AmmeMemoRadiSam system protein A/AmmeMemoRadiSam system protein B